MSGIQELANGFFAPFRGVQVIAGSKRLRRLAVFPFLLSLLLFIAGMVMGLPAIASLVNPGIITVLGLVGLVVGTLVYEVLFWILAVLIWPAALFALLYFLFVITRIFAAPLYALLAEQVLIDQKVIKEQPFHLVRWTGTNLRMLSISILKSILLLVAGVLLFVLSFVPGLAVFTGLGFLLIVVFDVMDYSFEAKQLNLSDRFRFFQRHILAFLGFSFAMGLVFFVPGLNFFLFPAAVAGAGDLLRRLMHLKAGSV